MWSLRRGSRDPATQAAVAFWRRWARLRDEVAAALDGGEPHPVESQVALAVAAMNPRLGWSLSGGRGERYVLVVTGEGDEQLRAVTDAWRRAAPSDEGWDYHDAAPAMDDPGDFLLGIGELQVALADVRVKALPDGDMLHVAVFHPALPQLAVEDRDALSFVALDTALGERLVERRIGRVEPVNAEPDQAMTLVQLRELVRATDARGVARTVCTSR